MCKWPYTVINHSEIACNKIQNKLIEKERGGNVYNKTATSVPLSDKPVISNMEVIRKRKYFAYLVR